MSHVTALDIQVDSRKLFSPLSSLLETGIQLNLPISGFLWLCEGRTWCAGSTNVPIAVTRWAHCVGAILMLKSDLKFGLGVGELEQKADGSRSWLLSEKSRVATMN